MDSRTIRILVVDDEEDLCEILQLNLELAGYAVDVAHSAEDALTMDLLSYDLILLDVMMGAMSGFHFAEHLKANPQTAAIPIIFCSARDTEADTVRGLEIGGDDYISKPFSLKEVIARVQSVLRRSRPAEPRDSQVLSYQTLQVHVQTKRCYVAGEEILLTRKEFDILSFLLAHVGKIFSREELLSSIWPDDVIVVDRTIDVNITRLRKKIAPYGKNIVTRIGYGYGFEA